MTTRPVTQADVAAYAAGYAAGHDDGTDHAAATTVGRIAELEGQLAAALAETARNGDLRADGDGCGSECRRGAESGSDRLNPQTDIRGAQ